MHVRAGTRARGPWLRCFVDVQDLVKFLHGDSVITDDEIQELGLYLAASRAHAGLASRATLAGASQGLEDSLWAARPSVVGPANSEGGR